MNTIDKTPQPDSKKVDRNKPPFTEELPDLSKPLSRWSAVYWAQAHGIQAALRSDSRWAVFCALCFRLPDVKPGKGGLELITGLSDNAVKAARKALKAVGLIDYPEGLKGGNPSSKNCENNTPYNITDIRDAKVAAAIVARIKGVKLEGGDNLPPVAQLHTTKEGGDKLPPTGEINSPHRGDKLPPRGEINSPKVHKGSSQQSTQEKSATGADAPWPADAGFPSPLAGEEDPTDGIDLFDLFPALELEAEEVEEDDYGLDDLSPEDIEFFEAISQGTIPTALNNRPSVSDLLKETTATSPAPTEATEGAATATSATETSVKPTRGTKGMGGGRKRGKLSPKDIAAIKASYGAMREHLLSGPRNWEPIPVERWGADQLAGFYWQQVSAARHQRNQPMALPDWSELGRRFNGLLQSETPAEINHRITFSIYYFDLVRSRIGGDIGAGLTLNEGYLFHKLVRQQAATLMAMSEPEREQVVRDYNATFAIAA